MEEGMSRKIASLLITLVLLASVPAGCGSTPEPTAVPEATQAPAPTSVPPTEAPQPEPAKLILATTTSTQDSGLLDYVLPNYQEEYNVQVEVIAVGTGQAIALGEDGNADVLLVHARDLEDAFMAAGHGVRREDVMYNDFVIVGPADDPADIQGMNKATRALEEIAKAEAPFVSRGDESGTHVKEKTIWAEAGIEPAGGWYISAGQGMGAVLTMADEQQAYTLTDRATYLARTLEGTELVILMEGDPILFNPYGVIAVNPDKNSEINNELANEFIDWLASLPTQELIAEFGVAEFGAPLFTPDSAAWREAQGSAEEPAGDFALRITGPATEIGLTEADLRAMETLDVDYTGKDGAVTTYTGVPMNALLEMAGAGEGATIVLVADDGYTAEIALADVQSCENCIVAFDPEGGLRSVLPEQSGKLQVKHLVEIQIQGGAPVEVPAGGIPEGAALKITGNVAQEIGWLEEDVRAMETMEAESTNRQGETETYTGVSINKLLEMAGPAADATTVTFVADDGYTAEAALAELQACADCIVSFRTQGGFSIVMPGFPGGVQVKGVIEIQVQ
jgi:tungstate transport system substrate-binding protein